MANPTTKSPARHPPSCPKLREVAPSLVSYVRACARLVRRRLHLSVVGQQGELLQQPRLLDQTCVGVRCHKPRVPESNEAAFGLRSDARRSRPASAVVHPGFAEVRGHTRPCFDGVTMSSASRARAGVVTK